MLILCYLSFVLVLRFLWEIPPFSLRVAEVRMPLLTLQNAKLQFFLKNSSVTQNIFCVMSIFFQILLLISTQRNIGIE